MERPNGRSNTLEQITQVVKINVQKKRGRMNRWFRKMNKGSQRGMILLLLQTAIGGGVHVLPNIAL